MKRLLARENLELLAQLAWSQVLLAFDFDGTLAPIVAEREQARMRPETARLLARVCELYPCAVISGRSRADVGLRLGRAALGYIVGNHGLEPGADLGAYEGEIAAVRPELEAALAANGGVEVEDKRYSLAIHYRNSRGKGAARGAILAAVARLRTPMRVVSGKLVINVVPRRAPNKGDALLALRTREGASTALYVGDDVTDEDVFSLDQPGRLFTVRVGESRTSCARYFLRNQREMDALLAKLAAMRSQGGR